MDQIESQNGREPVRVELGTSDYVAIIGRRWWLILLFVTIGIGGALYFTERTADRFTAQVMLQRKESRSPLEAMSSDRTGLPPTAIASQIEIIRSRTILATVVDSLGMRAALPRKSQSARDVLDFEIDAQAEPARYRLAIARDGLKLHTEEDEEIASATRGGVLEGPGFRIRLVNSRARPRQIEFRIQSADEAVTNLHRNLRVEPVQNSNIIRVRYTARSPRLAAAVVNSIADTYQQYATVSARQAAERRREFLARQLTDAADSLKRAQEALALYQRESRIIDPHTEGQNLANELMAAESDLRTFRFQEGVLEGLLTSLRGGGRNDVAFQRMLALSGDVMPAAPELYRRLQDLESERRRLTTSSAGFTETNTRVQVVDSMIRASKDEIRSVTEQSIGLLKSRLRSEESRVNDLRSRVGELPVRATEFTQLGQRSDAVQKTFDLLTDRYYEAQVAEATASGDVDIVDRASVPTRPDRSDSKRNLLLGILFGLAIATAIAILLENLDSSIRHTGDAEKVTGLETLGMIPEFRAKGDSMLRVRGAASPEREAFQALKATLAYLPTQKHVLAVTSQGPAEGKSVLAANLALGLAVSHRVLLVDADLRRPTQHSIFSVPNGAGLADVLRGKLSAFAAPQQFGNTHLFLVTAGDADVDTLDLLETNALAEFIESARREFDYIVIDTPPVLAVADTLRIARLVDGVIMIARAFATDRNALRRAVQQLQKVHAPLLGAVLNRVPLRKGKGYGSYYGYQSYASYYKSNGKSSKVNA